MGEEVEDDLVQRMRVEAATCETNAKFYEYPLEVPSVLLVSGASEIESLRAQLRDEQAALRANNDENESLRASLTRAEAIILDYVRDENGCDFAICKDAREDICVCLADTKVRLSRASGSELRGDHLEQGVTKPAAETEE